MPVLVAKHAQDLVVGEVVSSEVSRGGEGTGGAREWSLIEKVEGGTVL